MHLILLCVALSALVGWYGRNRAIGFSGCFVLSVLLKPFIVALVLLVTAPGKESEASAANQ